jgi:hypothetical protein
VVVVVVVVPDYIVNLLNGVSVMLSTSAAHSPSVY